MGCRCIERESPQHFAEMLSPPSTSCRIRQTVPCIHPTALGWGVFHVLWGLKNMVPSALSVTSMC